MFVITINVDYVNRLLSASNPAEVAIQLFWSGGWILFLWVFLWGLFKIWIDGRQNQYSSSMKKVLLALDIPKLNEQSPKAVEALFSTIHGSYSHHDRIEKYWIGKIQAAYSFEIVSIDGYVQFYVWVWNKFRDVLEAAVYAQYPDAEITEVEDYVRNAPSVFPSEEYDLAGSEFRLVNKPAFPIRTYPEFEDKLSGELKDPMSALLESLSKLRPGEQLWVQILVRPLDDKAWRHTGERVVRKLIGAKEKGKKPGMIRELLNFPMDLIEGGLIPAFEKKQTKDEPPTMMLHLSPGERIVVEGIQRKLAKKPFSTKIRWVYIARKDVFSKSRTFALMKGTFGQFTILDQNGLAQYGKATTKTDYPWQLNKKFEYLTLFMVRTLTTRQNSLFRAYRGRDMGVGAPPSVMNIEELATIYHFPVVQVKAPLVKKTESKRAEPPVSLPVMSRSVYAIPVPTSQSQRATSPPPRELSAPPTLPSAPPPPSIAETDEPVSTPENLPFV